MGISDVLSPPGGRLEERHGNWLTRKNLVIGAVALAGLVVILFLCSLFFSKGNGTEGLVARVTVAGQDVLRIDLFRYQDGKMFDYGLITQGEGCDVKLSQEDGDLLLKLEPMDIPITLRLKKNFKLRVEEAGCKDQSCVKKGYVGKLHQTIECKELEMKITVEEKSIL